MGNLQRTLSRGRRAAEARMLDDFAIMESTGIDYVDGAEVETYALLFTTKGRVKTIGAYGIDREVGARTAVEVVRELHIPVDSPATPAKAVAFVTAVHETSDPTLLDAGLVLEPTVGSQTTARRMKVTEVLS